MDDVGLVNLQLVKKKKKKLHWVTGAFASLSSECSRQKMQVNNKLLVWLRSSFLLELLSSWGCFTSKALKPSGLGVTDLTLGTYVI